MAVVRVVPFKAAGCVPARMRSTISGDRKASLTTRLIHEALMPCSRASSAIVVSPSDARRAALDNSRPSATSHDHLAGIGRGAVRSALTGTGHLARLFQRQSLQHSEGAGLGRERAADHRSCCRHEADLGDPLSSRSRGTITRDSPLRSGNLCSTRPMAIRVCSTRSCAFFTLARASSICRASRAHLNPGSRPASPKLS